MNTPSANVCYRTTRCFCRRQAAGPGRTPRPGAGARARARARAQRPGLAPGAHPPGLPAATCGAVRSPSHNSTLEPAARAPRSGLRRAARGGRLFCPPSARARAPPAEPSTAARARQPTPPGRPGGRPAGAAAPDGASWGPPRRRCPSAAARVVAPAARPWGPPTNPRAGPRGSGGGRVCALPRLKGARPGARAPPLRLPRTSVHPFPGARTGVCCTRGFLAATRRNTDPPLAIALLGRPPRAQPHAACPPQRAPAPRAAEPRSRPGARRRGGGRERLSRGLARLLLESALRFPRQRKCPRVCPSAAPTNRPPPPWGGPSS
ncbi:MAG: hypothetical protein J3K34DRAFT_93494 [Monoraphidium minutum]|nr:MAG: hypothetical protein J3K34DRAFT_93494 [Monoraphidium minutum]